MDLVELHLYCEDFISELFENSLILYENFLNQLEKYPLKNKTDEDMRIPCDAEECLIECVCCTDNSYYRESYLNTSLFINYRRDVREDYIKSPEFLLVLGKAKSLSKQAKQNYKAYGSCKEEEIYGPEIISFFVIKFCIGGIMNHAFDKRFFVEEAFGVKFGLEYENEEFWKIFLYPEARMIKNQTNFNTTYDDICNPFFNPNRNMTVMKVDKLMNFFKYTSRCIIDIFQASNLDMFDRNKVNSKLINLYGHYTDSECKLDIKFKHYIISLGKFMYCIPEEFNELHRTSLTIYFQEPLDSEELEIFEEDTDRYLKSLKPPFDILTKMTFKPEFLFDFYFRNYLEMLLNKYKQYSDVSFSDNDCPYVFIDQVHMWSDLYECQL